MTSQMTRLKLARQSCRAKAGRNQGETKGKTRERQGLRDCGPHSQRLRKDHSPQSPQPPQPLHSLHSLQSLPNPGLNSVFVLVQNGFFAVLTKRAPACKGIPLLFAAGTIRILRKPGQNARPAPAKRAQARRKWNTNFPCGSESGLESSREPRLEHGFHAPDTTFLALPCVETVQDPHNTGRQNRLAKSSDKPDTDKIKNHTGHARKGLPSQGELP